MNPTELRLLRRLAAAFERFDPVPAGIEAAAERAGVIAGTARSWLAVVADGSVGHVRGEGGGRLLGFAWVDGRVDVYIDSGATGVQLSGLVSGVVGSVWVRWPGGEVRADVDEFGRFVVVGLPAGPLSLAVRGAGVDSVGPWFVA
ncbi:MAG TPA: hypothetical protein VH352_15800 [Pseudonocardiaceae bacterium]|nr:hypothetical protein [Pseudonocardiaceae bacterium]